MKTFIKILAVFSLVLLMGNACTDDFESMNTPNDLIVRDLVDIDMMFTRVLATSVVVHDEDGFGTVGNWAGMSVSGGNRPFILGESNGVWDNTYTDYAHNISDIIDICKTSENSEDLVNKKAVARILRVWFFAKLTDTYGNVPYFESCLPVANAVTTPKYDDQKDIYIDLFKELKEAVAEIDDTKPVRFDGADLLYGGNLDQWKKFGNSLRLRLAIRIRYADPTMASDQIADLTEDDLIIERVDDAYIPMA